MASYSCTTCRGAFWRGYYSFRNTLTRTPDLHLLHELCEQLNRSLAQAGSSYSEFVEACNTTIDSCEDAAQICARKANEAQKNKRVSRVIGGTASGIAFGVAVGLATAATGPLAPIAAGAAAGVGALGAVTTHCIAKDFAESEASFRSIQRDFNRLLRLAFDLKEGVARVHTYLESISTQVDTIAYCIRNGSHVLLVQDALKHLNDVCANSYDTTSRWKNTVDRKIQDLKGKVNTVEQ